MFYKILILVLVTFLPFFELRASIPLGVLENSVHLPFGLVLEGFGMNWVFVFLVCVIANIILGLLIYIILNQFVEYFLRFRVFRRIYTHYVRKTQDKAAKYVEKYGEIGIALFIGVPLPGSGVYTGALGAYLLGLSYKKFFVANVIGVLIAGILVTLVSLGLFNIL